MGAVVALDTLLQQRQVWKGQPTGLPAHIQPTGHAALDAALPAGGWPDTALSEILYARDGMGELQLLWPTLARLSQAGERIMLVAPPFIPYVPAWQAAGIDQRQLVMVDAAGDQALWAAEQCLRSGCFGAVICWPQRAGDRALRRIQVAAETGETLAFAYRPLAESANPSPAALRLVIDDAAGQVRVLKCRGGRPSANAISIRAGR
ncbi:translesion DNA synthesis-associated protein ImuA [Halopseudomonas salina]|uniref:Translesion DNA synthesis-associated protein ImuA n=1 Tax=Halopseudomonas salina TaxID=1323744 RepID=A0ABQ1NUR3_9GAMM|nr:translesion DNA synthesis-associated protein ImuA [Halopseudomonas salina]GGC85567.1 hypothetical protein GCM10007418_01650 [Halopseudomonas salina]